MHKLIMLFLFGVVTSIAFSQEITIEQIWKNYDFYPRSVQGFNSMADGVSYTVQGQDYSILKYNITDLGKGLDKEPEILFSPPSSGFTYSDYEFNSDES